MAADLFVVPTITWRLLFAWSYLRTTADELSPWRSPRIQQQHGRHSNCETPFRRTRRPGIYCTIAIQSLRTSRPPSKGMNIQEVRTAPRSPWQNAYVERVIGSIRRECLDHVIVVNASGLRRVLTEYVAYYMRSRTPLGLGRDTPSPRPVTPLSAGRIVAIPEVGGLHHRYDHVAA